MHVAVSNLPYRAAHPRYLAFHSCNRYVDLSSIPERLLALLPKRPNYQKLKQTALEEAQYIVEYVENSSHNELLATHVLGDHGAWLAAIQRTQIYSLQLLQPLRVIAASIKDGDFKIRGLTSREWATLASISAKTRINEASYILKRLCEPESLKLMLPDLRSSDLAMFLSALAKSNMIHHVCSFSIREECLQRIPTMGTFDISVTFDAISRLRCNDHAVADLALARFASLIKEASSKTLSKLSRKIREIADPFSGSSKLRGGSGHGESDSMIEYRKINEIALFMRAIVRLDGVREGSLTYLADVAAQISPGAAIISEKDCRGRDRMMSSCTTIIMSLCYVLSKFGGKDPCLVHLNNVLMTLFLFIRYRMESYSFSLKDRTKLCLAIHSYWHLSRNRSKSSLILDIYNNIVRDSDDEFLRSVGNKKEHSHGDCDSNITDEVESCLLKLAAYSGISDFMRAYVALPYKVIAIDKLRGLISTEAQDCHLK